MTATLPGEGETIGLIAHVDTSPDAPGAGVEPIVHRDHDGSPIALPRGGTVVEAPPPATTSSPRAATPCSAPTTRPAWPRSWPRSPTWPRIRSARARRCASASRPTRRSARARRCSTSSASAPSAPTRSTAPTSASCRTRRSPPRRSSSRSTASTPTPAGRPDVLVNAARLAGEILAALPADLTPERTSGREGFIHPYEVEGSAGRAVIRAIVRDFDDDKLAAHTALLRRTAEEVVGRAPGRAARGRGHAAVPEHAPLPRRRSRGGRGRRGRRFAPRASRSCARRSAAAPTAHG